MPSSKTTNLDLNVGYAETDRTQSWIDGIDNNFRNLDNDLGTVFKAIENAGITLSRNVALEDEWSTGAYLLNTTFLSSFKNASAIRFGTYIYVFIGSENAEGDIYKFNSVKYTLTKIDAKVPLGFNNFKVEQYQGRVFLIGGCENQTASNLFYIFDIANEEILVPDTTLSISLTNCGSCIINNYIYLFGGNDENGNQLNSILKFNVADYSNSLLSLSLLESDDSLSATAIEDNVYLFGGNNSNKIYEFDSINETITLLNETLPTNIKNHQSILLDDNIYILGGKNGNQILDTIYKFDYNNKTISTLDFILPIVLSNFAIAVTDNYAYLFGGETTNGNSTRIIRFVP